MLDTLTFSRRLTKAGMAREQAEEFAAALNEALEGAAATKADLQELRVDLRAEIAELRAEIAEVRAQVVQLRADLDGLRTEFRTEMAALEARLEQRILRVAFVSSGVIIGAMGLMITVAGFLVRFL